MVGSDGDRSLVNGIEGIVGVNKHDGGPCAAGDDLPSLEQLFPKRLDRAVLGDPPEPQAQRIRNKPNQSVWLNLTAHIATGVPWQQPHDTLPLPTEQIHVLSHQLSGAANLTRADDRRARLLREVKVQP